MANKYGCPEGEWIHVPNEPIPGGHFVKGDGTRTSKYWDDYENQVSNFWDPRFADGAGGFTSTAWYTGGWSHQGFVSNNQCWNEAIENTDDLGPATGYADPIGSEPNSSTKRTTFEKAYTIPNDSQPSSVVVESATNSNAFPALGDLESAGYPINICYKSISAEQRNADDKITFAESFAACDCTDLAAINAGLNETIFFQASTYVGNPSAFVDNDTYETYLTNTVEEIAVGPNADPMWTASNWTPLYDPDYNQTLEYWADVNSYFQSSSCISDCS